MILTPLIKPVEAQPDPDPISKRRRRALRFWQEIRQKLPAMHRLGSIRVSNATPSCVIFCDRLAMSGARNSSRAHSKYTDGKPSKLDDSNGLTRASEASWPAKYMRLYSRESSWLNGLWATRFEWKPLLRVNRTKG